MKTLASCLAFFSLFVAIASLDADAANPNIIFMMCDDLGYGDVNCLAPDTCKIDTPGADQLAREGMIFTDAHSGSSVCTPTRYGIMTGRYSWRTTLQKGVVTGFAPCLIAKDRMTVAGFLRQKDYDTAIIGKWHLNFQYLNPDSNQPYQKSEHQSPPVNSVIPDGPVHRGFDFFHGFHHARNMEAVVENNRVIEHDDPVNMLPRLTGQCVKYIDSRADQQKPFFLYVPLGSPHTPIVPSKEWQGKSSLGKYGDFVMQTDNVVVEVLEALKRNNLSNNTLFIFTSDNGCSKAAGIKQLKEKGHIVSAHLRGSKADLWDGGHRIPFIARWPGKIQPGSTSDQLICLADFFATAAAILESKVPRGTCEDSVSFLPALMGDPIQSTRQGVVHHSFSGHFGYRQANWKLLLARGSGGWTSPTEKQAGNNVPKAQLYDMQSDVGETTNLYKDKPDVAERLLKQLSEDVFSGRSTQGQAATNDVDRIDLWKSETGPDDTKAKKKSKKGRNKQSEAKTKK